MERAYFTFKLVRSFALGFTIFSPKLNGVSFCIYLGCFHLSFDARGTRPLLFRSYWRTD